MRRAAILGFLSVIGVLAEPAALQAAGEGRYSIHLVDKKTREPIAARMHLKDPRGRPVNPPKSVFWKDHFAIDGEIELKLKPGQYNFELERGPEYRSYSGYFVMTPGAEDTRVIEMERYVDMKSEGWWSGDLHVHRSPEEIEVLMRSEDLHVAPVITWWNEKNRWKHEALPEPAVVQFDSNRFYHLLAGEDEREGGALLFFQLPKPLPLAGATREYPSPVVFLDQARAETDAHIDIEKPFWWDVPVWIATGKVDSMGIAHNHLWRDGVLDNEAWGKPRDTTSYPKPQGNGRWSHDIYFHLLNCGIHLPPSAGSASGVLPNPAGYNRVYAYCGDELTYEKWFEALRQGQVVVTNGPLLRPRINGELPGHTFRAAEGETVTLNVALDFAIRDPASYLEIIKNGEVIHEVRLEEYRNRRGQLPDVEFKESGWLMIRAIMSTPQTFRFGCTGPVYVEIGDRPHISKKSAQFFLDWVYERARRLKLDDPRQRAEVLAFHRQAKDFWEKRVADATAP